MRNARKSAREQSSSRIPRDRGRDPRVFSLLSFSHANVTLICVRYLKIDVSSTTFHG